MLREDVGFEVDLVARRERAQCRHLERVRDQRDLEPVVVERRDRERDAVDGDRALLDAVAEDAPAGARSRRGAVSPARRADAPTPSTWPWTMWPPSGSPARSAARRSPRRRGEAAERRHVERLATTSNASLPFRRSTTVRQTPAIATESPTAAARLVSGAETTSSPSSGEKRCPPGS